MPHLYMDLMRGHHRVQDSKGNDYTSIAEARKQALVSLTEMSLSGISDGGPCRIAVTIRDENFCYLVASLTIDEQPIIQEIKERSDQAAQTLH